jgi:splicing factor U2AF subunit
LEKNASGTTKVSDYNAEKLRREIFVGNLVSGQIGATTLCELLNDVLKKIVPEACHAVGKLPPVLSIVMDSAQKYASLEMRSAALATAALGLDQMHVLGRPLHISRPEGYFDDPDAKRQVLNISHVLPPPEKLQQVYDDLDACKSEETKLKDEATERAKKIAASMSENAVRAAEPTPAEVTEYLCLENMVDIKTLLSARERKELRYDIEDECGKCGKVIRVVVPTPNEDEIERKAESRAYVHFARVSGAESAHKVMHGRKFGGRVVQARYIDAREFEAFDKK